MTRSNQPLFPFPNPWLLVRVRRCKSPDVERFLVSHYLVTPSDVPTLPWRTYILV